MTRNFFFVFLLNTIHQNYEITRYLLYFLLITVGRVSYRFIRGSKIEEMTFKVSIAYSVISAVIFDILVSYGIFKTKEGSNNVSSVCIAFGFVSEPLIKSGLKALDNSSDSIVGTLLERIQYVLLGSSSIANKNKNKEEDKSYENK